MIKIDDIYLFPLIGFSLVILLCLMAYHYEKKFDTRMKQLKICVDQKVEEGMIYQDANDYCNLYDRYNENL